MLCGKRITHSTLVPSIPIIVQAPLSKSPGKSPSSLHDNAHAAQHSTTAAAGIFGWNHSLLKRATRKPGLKLFMPQ